MSSFKSFHRQTEEEGKRNRLTKDVEKGKVDGGARGGLASPVEHGLRVEGGTPAEKVDPAKDGGQDLKETGHACVSCVQRRIAAPFAARLYRQMAVAVVLEPVGRVIGGASETYDKATRAAGGLCVQSQAASAAPLSPGRVSSCCEASVQRGCVG
jgi:hypothetical protein